MLIYEKIIFDCYYCINSAEMNEIMVHYILQPHHIFIRIKAFVFSSPARSAQSYCCHLGRIRLRLRLRVRLRVRPRHTFG